MGSGHAHTHGHAHGHAPGTFAQLDLAGRRRNEKLLTVVLALLVAFVVAEIVGAVLANSVALFADAGHMLVDAGSVAGSLWASRLARRPPRDRWTFGLDRAEILAAAINALSLVVAGALVGVEAINRLLHPVTVSGWPVLAVALTGVAVNLVATLLLLRGDHSGLNMRAAFAHVVTDLYAFAGTLVAAIVIIATGYDRADAIASLLVVALMFWAAAPLLRASGRVLLEGAPDGVDLAEVRQHLLETNHVHDVHDLHCWTVGHGLPVLSVHVVIDPSCFQDGHAPQMLDALQECLLGHFDVEHSTFQLEPLGHAEHEVGAHA
jgi:cobalt-zinc-cadmium efflux system protein